MKMLFFTICFSSLLTPALAFAKTTTLTVEGMHCGGCKKMISEKVCEDTALKSTFETCSVSITDSSKHLGEVKIVPKKDAKIDLVAIKNGVQSAGDGYKVIKEETK